MSAPVPRLAVSALSALLLAGCAAVGPNYTPPSPAAPLAFKNAPAPATAALPAPDRWWQAFADPILDALETDALAHNPTLAAALARVDEARARLGLSRAERHVALSASGNAKLAGETAERTLPIPGRPVTYRERGDSYRLAFDAGYELDLWGRVRHSLESAAAQLAASEADQRGVRLALTADVAQAYVQLRALEAETTIVAQTLTARHEAVAVLRSRCDAGLTPELDLQRARVELATLEADQADLARRREQMANALALLTGHAPADCAAPAAGTGAPMPGLPPPGLPADLLRRRPDIAAAEALLHARTAEIGAAQAARFPSIRLTGGAGFESAELAHLVERPAQFWQLGPSFSVPLLDGGRTKASIAAAQARADAALAEYRQLALLAFREVEDALVELRQQNEQEAALGRADAAARTTVELAGKRQAAGFVTYLEVVEAQRSQLQIARAQTQLAGARAATTVRLIRALGGGW